MLLVDARISPDPFCELCWGSEAFNRQPTTPGPLKEDLIWFHPATAPADETSTGTTLRVARIVSNPRGENVRSLPSVPTLQGFWHCYSKTMDMKKTWKTKRNTIYEFDKSSIPLTIQESRTCWDDHISSSVKKLTPKSITGEFCLSPRKTLARSSGKRSTQGWGCECTPLKIIHDNGRKTVWRRISYQKWSFFHCNVSFWGSIIILVIL